MASPVDDIERNLPDTLPADFGEWDESSSQDSDPAGTPAWKPLDTTPKESPQRESARREAEALDFAKKPSVSREVSREFEPATNVTPFPEPDEIPATPRGIPAPVIRAPRTSPAPSSNSSSPSSSSSTLDESAFARKMKSVDTVVDKLPAVEARNEEAHVSAISLMDRKQDKPLFSSIAVEETEESEDRTLLNDLLEEEEERKTRRKWITTACIFGGSLLLVVFQIIHYTSASKIKHIVNTPRVTAINPEPEPLPETVADVKQVAEKPSAAERPSAATPSSEPDAVQVDDTPAQPVVRKPGAAQTQMMQTQLMAPTRLPQNAKSSGQNDAPPSSLGEASIAALNGNSTMGNVFTGRSNSKVNVSGPKPVTVSAGVAVGMLIHQTQPVYPPIARSARVQGTVVLSATISKTGKVVNLKVVSGPPMLRQSAIDAVKTWQYKPYTLNGEPTDVDTTISLNFSLGG